MKRFFLYMVLCGVLAVAASCGYSTRSLINNKYRTIHVEPFRNKVVYTTESNKDNYFPLLEVKITNAVIDRFLFDGNLRATHKDTADLILQGELIGYDRSALRYTDDNEVQESRVHIVVSLRLWDPVEEKYVWEEPNFAGESTYFLSGTLATTESAAIEQAVEDLARRVVERTIEDW